MIKEKYINNVKETSINITNSNVDSVRIKNNTKTSFRIYKDGFIVAQERKYDRDLLLQECDVILSAFNNKVELPENKIYPVVVYSSMAPMNKLISDLEANIFASGSSLFSDKIG